MLNHPTKLVKLPKRQWYIDSHKLTERRDRVNCHQVAKLALTDCYYYCTLTRIGRIGITLLGARGGISIEYSENGQVPRLFLFSHRSLLLAVVRSYSVHWCCIGSFCY